MRFDHIVIHVDNDLQKLRSLQEALNAQGYFFDPARGNRSREYSASRINVGGEYIEIVRLFRPESVKWMPLWTNAYNRGQRGAFCIFLEVEDVERTAVALKKAGIAAVGPAVLSYPVLLGLLHLESPYLIYFLPHFPDSTLQIALLQYKKKGGREAFQAGLQPNALQNGINGIRRVEILLPKLDDSMAMIQKVFPDLFLEKEEWAAQLEKTRILFGRSPDSTTHVRLSTITSQRAYVGHKFQVENVELITTGG